MNKSVSLLAAALLASAAAQAEPAWLADFRKADLNDSGGLSKVELDKAKSASLKPIKDNFAAIDADKDGHVTQAEYERYARQTDDKLYEKLRKADLNDSGGLSRVELDKAGGGEFDEIKRNFDAIDADKDGHVTRLEYDNWRLGAAAVAAPTAPGAAPADRCQPNCGRVVDINIVKTEGGGSGIGAVAGGVAGGVLGNEVAGGTVATVGGAAGGAYIGHQLEKKYRSKKIIRVTVRLDDGRQQNFDLDTDKSPFVSGERVQVKDGKLIKYTGQ